MLRKKKLYEKLEENYLAQNIEKFRALVNKVCFSRLQAQEENVGPKK
jgi:hypothetical protein